MDLRDYLELEGNSQQKLADKLGVSQGLISQHLAWLAGKKKNAAKITAERAIEYETATGGQVTRHDLRPDVFGRRPARAAA